MRKIICALLSVVILSGQATVLCVHADETVSVFINGNKIQFDQQPVIIDDRVMVPIRSIFENMDYNLDWTQSTQTAVAVRMNDEIVIQQDNNIISYRINGESGTYVCDVPPQNISERILVPVRAIAESSAYDVEWDGSTKTVYISNYKNGTYDISFRSECRLEDGATGNDITYGFNYMDDLFFESSRQYSNALAVVSLGAALSAFSSKESDMYYESDTIESGALREKNIINTYNTLGFSGAEFYNYDKSLNDLDDKAAYSFAYKNINTGSNEVTVIPVVIRGGGYGAEWVSNFKLGSGAVHEGFLTAANEIALNLKEYADKLRKEGLLRNDVRYWVTGYSRGAAVAGIVSAMINNDMSRFYASDVFGYCFAAPQWLNNKYSSEFNKEYPGIFNIINRGDAITAVALSQWGYCRAGHDIYLNGKSADDYTAAADALSKITGNMNLRTAVNTVANQSGADEFIYSLGNLADSNIEYTEKYQEYIMDICELICTKYINSDGSELGLSDKYEKKYGKTVESSMTSSDILMMSLISQYIGNNYTDNINCLIAVARNDNIDINFELLIFVINFLSYYFTDVPINNNTELGTNLACAHYPEVYLAWLVSSEI